ncbi:hypothetical protein GCM10022389_19930 [Flavobacterium cheonanense]|uniref:Nuclear transport factor 2 family protein n=2 Tax=Flavobacterium cheonanense TaxID=706183 RepID=A0ABP7VU25_9FLAO
MFMNFKLTLLVVLGIVFSNTTIVYSQNTTKVVITDVNNDVLKAKMENNASEFLTTLNTSFLNKSTPAINSKIIISDVSASLLSMWEMSPFRCYEADVIEKAIKRPQGGYEVRNIPVFMQEAAEDDQYQEIVLLFTDSGLIDNIYISMETNRYNQLISQGTDVTEFRRRQIILDFVENFKTAYNRKDISYLQSVFSEDALIITGKVVQVKSPDASSNLMNSAMVTYQKQTKAEYLNKLKSIFKNNSYINVKFDDIEIKRHKKYPDMYGVNMMQGWNTTNYSDVGYLLLVIDFADDDKPLIHVRTWQPEKVGSRTLSEDEKFKLENFNLNK